MKRSTKIILASLIMVLIASIGFNIHSAYINNRQRISVMSIIFSYAHSAMLNADHSRHATPILHESTGIAVGIMLLQIDTVIRSDFNILRNQDGSAAFHSAIATIGGQIIMEPVLENRIAMLDKILPHLQSLVLEMSINDDIEFPVMNTRLSYAEFIAILSRFAVDIRLEFANYNGDTQKPA